MPEKNPTEFHTGAVYSKNPSRIFYGIFFSKIPPLGKSSQFFFYSDLNFDKEFTDIVTTIGGNLEVTPEAVTHKTAGEISLKVVDGIPEGNCVGIS